MYDLWRSGFVRRSLASVTAGGLTARDVTWLPDQGDFAYVADPFGIARDARLTVFVEHFEAVADRINSTPRKCLNYRTPHDVLGEQIKLLKAR